MGFFDRFRRNKGDDAARLEAQRLAAEQEQREQDRLAAERAERERADAQRAGDERRAAEQVERDRQEQERLATQEAEDERRAAEQAERDRAENERAEQDRLAAERAERERADAQRAEDERRAAEQAERDRREQERLAAEAQRSADERAEAERRAAEQAERDRAEAERLHQERLAAQEAEQERLAAQQAERDRVEAERAGEPEELRAEREKVDRLLEAVGPELRTRRILDLLGATFGRLAPPHEEWGSCTIEFRPAPGHVFLRVSTDSPDGGRTGAGGWKPVASMVEILIQELQRSMYEPGEGTWIDGRVTFTHRGEREDRRGRPLPPEADVAVNFDSPPTVGSAEHPYRADDAVDFLTRFPRDAAHIPVFMTELARTAGRNLPVA